MTLEIGDTIPSFDLPTDSEGRVSDADLKGKKVVLYFYPKDDTPGCTKEAQAFRDSLADFEAAGVEIYGVSKDKPAKHDKFKAKYDLPFTLISDEEGTLCEAFGVWVEKSMYGRKYMGIERSTFLIDGGEVKTIWRKVKVNGHAEAVLAEAKSL
ncbi:MAG: thioredoxin-dependent thiol peroxidase [Magnetovibrionaceae bacterium]